MVGKNISTSIVTLKDSNNIHKAKISLSNCLFLDAPTKEWKSRINIKIK